MLVWASWHWGHKFLPAKIHTSRDEFKRALDMFRKASIVDGTSGVPVVLGLGLLYQECWTAHLSDDQEGDEPLPAFIEQSKLSNMSADLVDDVIQAIAKKVVPEWKTGWDTNDVEVPDASNNLITANVSGGDSEEGLEMVEVEVKGETARMEVARAKEVRGVEEERNQLEEEKRQLEEEIRNLVATKLRFEEETRERGEPVEEKGKEKKGKEKSNAAKNDPPPPRKDPNSPLKQTRTSNHEHKPSKKKHGSDLL